MDEALPFDSGHNVGSGFGEIGSYPSNGGGLRGEVDTSAPFESVKEAVTRFGGIGFWKPHIHKPSHASQSCIEEVFDAAKLEEQAVQLSNDLVVKERETLEVLKALEATKTTVEELKVKLQTESRKGNDENAYEQHSGGHDFTCPSSAPGLILMELKQAKLNLTWTTNDLADIRSTVETYTKKIKNERVELEKTRQRLSLNSSSFTTFEDVDFSRELHRLTSETEQFWKVGEIAKSDVVKANNHIEQTKMRIKTAEIRLIAVRKLKEAAKASEALARSEIKSLSKSQSLSEQEGVTLSFEEYHSLKMKSREAEEASKMRVNEAMVRVNEAEISKTDILKRVQEATEEVKNSKRVLEEAMSKVSAAHNDKLKAEEALRKWRSDHGQRRKSTVQSSTKFKNSGCRSNTNTRLLDVNGARLLDVNGARLGSNGPGPFDVNGPHLGRNGSGRVLRPMMSIGQILSQKLLLTEEYSERRKVSLAQMLSKPSNGDGVEKRRSTKRKKFGFGRISFLVAKPSKKKKKKKHSISSRLSCVED